MKQILSFMLILFLIVFYMDYHGLTVQATDYIVGADISENNASSNWNVATANMDFVIIRCGTGKGTQTNFVEDVKFKQHYNGAVNAGLQVGLYFYTFASTKEAMRSNVEDALAIVNGRHLDLPIYLDFERSGGEKMKQEYLSRNELTALAIYGCDLIRQAGYQAGVYANKDWFSRLLNPETIRNAGYETWIAHYTNSISLDYSNSFDMWQYTENGSPSGIGKTKNGVDMNVRYTSNPPKNRIDTTIDTSYNTNVSCTAPSKIYTYDVYGNLEGNRYVDSGDECVAIEAYTSGYWKIDYPSGSTRRQAYMKLSEWNPFPSPRIDASIDTSYNTNVSCTAPSKIYTYDVYGNLEGNRYVDSGDECIAIEAYTSGYWKIDYPSGSTRRQAYMKLSEWNPFSKAGHNPVGYLDGATGGNGTVTVSGWAYDEDTPNEAVEIHIYMDGEAGVGTCVATGIMADKERPDVNNAGYPGNHGFEATINISATGTHTFYAHAINRGASGEGFPNTLLTNHWNVTISEPIPHGTEMLSGAGQTIADGYYGIYSQLAENYYLDIDGADVPAVNGTNVHVWKHDDNGLPMCDVWEVRYADNGFYTIRQMNSDSALDVCGADTARGTNVQSYTSNGSDAQLWSISPQDSGYKIQSKCNGYYLDVAGGSTESGTNVHVWEENETAAQMWSLVPYDEDAPAISDVKVTNVTAMGYTIQCTVQDVGKSGIDRVQFPAWTAKNNQDDLLSDWSSNSRASGIIDGNKVTFTVNISDHNNEWGVYQTHIYAFDKCGNYTCVAVDDIFVSSQIEGDVNMDGELGIADVILLQKWILAVPNTHL